MIKQILIISLTYSNLLSIDCAIPSLSVRKVDRRLIEKKRQDTIEMCRLFNEENARQNRNHLSDLGNNSSNQTMRRAKRNVDLNTLGNPALKEEDVLRVENIVDKLYDDLEQNGIRFPYRQRTLEPKSTTMNVNNKQHRRFNFAPAQLFGPLPENVYNSKLNAVRSPKIPWIKEWTHGIVPFFIDSGTYDSHLADIILKAFDYIEKVSCIRLQRLREKPTDKKSMQKIEWLYITNPSGIRQCVHSNEGKRNKGVQMVVFGYDCMSQGEIAHEVMHILGFSHEHVRADRDRYITILWDNIKPGYKKYFKIKRNDGLLSLPYDYASVLHYPPRAFSRNGQITVKTEGNIKVGQREALSEIDIQKIGMVYGIECVERNNDYMLKTCPSVVRNNTKTTQITSDDIKEYFKNRIWPYGIVNYQLKDKIEFSAEEKENIKAVFNHIEKETCIEFRDISIEDEDENNNVNSSGPTPMEHKKNDYNKPEEKQEHNLFYIPDVPNAFGSWKMSLKVITVTRAISKSTNVLKEFDTSNESALRTGKNEKKFKVKTNRHNELRKGRKSISTSNKTVLPKSPARRHAANVLMLTRTPKPGCKCPSPGRPNGNKELPINSDCFNSVNDLLHFVVHILGLDHQHNMHDRDSFLHIIWNNLTQEIREEMKDTLPPAASAGFAYDYQSVMHYPWLEIKNGVTSIMYPIWNDGWAMGHWQGLSWTDVQKLNLIYMDECEKRKRHTHNT